MRTAIVQASDFQSSLRLDALYHCNEAAAAQRTLNTYGRLAPLQEVAERIFNGTRFARTYVTPSPTSLPFLSSAHMLQTDLRSVKHLARSQASAMPDVIIQQGGSLISRSGTVGHAVYVRRDMDGMAASEHVMRVVPKPGTDPGYLFAYLASGIARSLMTKQTYGSVVQHIEPHHLHDLPVPILDNQATQEIGDLIRAAAEARGAALEDLAAAEAMLYDATGLTRGALVPDAARLGFGVAAAGLEHDYRLDPDHYAPHSLAALGEVRAREGIRLRDLATRVFVPPIFTRIYSSLERGLRYLSQVDLLALRPLSERYISLTRTPRLEEYIVAEGYVLVLGAGQEAVGTPFFVGPDQDGTVPTSDVLRIVAREPDTAGFIYAYLASEHGRAQLRRFVYGSSIPRLAPGGVENVLLPWDRWAREAAPAIHALVVRAHARRHEANVCEDRAQERLKAALAAGAAKTRS